MPPIARTAVHTVLLAAVAALTPLLLHPEFDRLPDRSDLSMYLVMPDRFDDGDTSNNDANGRCVPGDPLSVQGGDLKGLERRLPYLRALGINAIWLTPVQHNVPGAFHGNWIQHFKRVDPRLGTMEDLQRLIRKAHGLGMRVYLDVVCNHTGPMISHAEGRYRWNEEGYTLQWADSARMPTPEALQDLSMYHNFGDVKEWTDPYQVLGELPGGLDDLRTEDPRVLAVMIEIWTWWMEQTGCDGFRVDTVKHVGMPFWYAWLEAVRTHARESGRREFFIFGEVFTRDDSKCASYTLPDARGRRGFDAVYNFSLAEAVRDVFQGAADVTVIAESLGRLALYAPDSRDVLLNFVDNHDITRFPAQTGTGVEGLKSALTFVYGMRGIPLLYYGTEQGFIGGTGGDHENRETMFAGGYKGANPPGDAFDTTSVLFRHVRGLNALRSANDVLRRGGIEVLRADSSSNVLIVKRSMGAKQAYIVLNAGSRAYPAQFPAAGAIRIWHEGRTERRPRDGTVSVPPGSTVIVFTGPDA